MPQNPPATDPRDADAGCRRVLVAAVGERRDRLVARLAGPWVALEGASDARSALARPLPDAALVAGALEDGDGLDLCAELRERDGALPIVLLDAELSGEAARRAVRLGLVDVLPRGADDGALRDALDAALGRAPKHGAGRSGPLRRRATTAPDALEPLLRELAADALRRGFGPAFRARLTGAVAEVVDNARRHAYPDGAGPVEVVLDLEREPVRVVVRDRGRGADPLLLQLAAVPAALPRSGGETTGLARAAALADGLDVRAGSGGVEVELSFRAHAVSFDEEGDDLSEVELIVPALARRLVLAATGRGDRTLFNLPPALAPSVGRLLAGPSPGAAQRALWSATR